SANYECATCPADFSQPDRCEEALSSSGWEHQCNTYGGSAWEEVWCRSVPFNGTGASVEEGSGEEARVPEIETRTRDIALGGVFAAFALVSLALVSRKRATE
ncbi:MAG: hypothetical protein KC561_04005, partial [Myxococcales bacterium]|nr:hypothetical protein [Myxococcales bacterium]